MFLSRYYNRFCAFLECTEDNHCNSRGTVSGTVEDGCVCDCFEGYHGDECEYEDEGKTFPYFFIVGSAFFFIFDETFLKQSFCGF